MPSEEYLRSKIIFSKDEWIYAPFKGEYHEINTFDDGFAEYINHENKWVIFGKWNGKLALYNLLSPVIIIPIISRWKVNNAKPLDADLKWRVNIIEQVFQEADVPIPNSIDL